LKARAGWLEAQLRPCGDEAAGAILSQIVMAKASKDFDAEIYIKLLRRASKSALKEAAAEIIKSPDPFIPVPGAIWTACEAKSKAMQTELRAIQRILQPRDPAPREMTQDERAASLARIKAYRPGELFKRATA